MGDMQTVEEEICQEVKIQQTNLYGWKEKGQE
jgi:hypothetical protein